MEFSHVDWSIDKKVLTITLNRPQAKNAVSQKMYQELTELLRRAGPDPDIHIVVLRGAGEMFCGGADFSDFDDPLGKDKPHPSLDYVPTLIRFPKPIIAAVQGVAVGVGATTLLHCDIVLAAKSARFRFPFTEMGLVPEVAASSMLPAIMGYHRAARLLFEADFVDAQFMFDNGLVTELTGEEDLWSRAEALAIRLAKKSNSALSSTKFLLRPSTEQLVERSLAEFGEIARLLSDKTEFTSRFGAYAASLKAED